MIIKQEKKKEKKKGNISKSTLTFKKKLLSSQKLKMITYL